MGETVWRMVQVDWIDSTSLSDGWDSIEHYVEMGESLICKTVGYLIHEDDEKIILAMGYNPDNDEVNQATSIPAVTVTKITDLQEVPEGLWVPSKNGSAIGVDKSLPV